jgi:hypothetical protein
MREKILLAGDSNTSKTMSLITLALAKTQSKVYIIDPDDGTNKLLGELGLTEGLANLVVIPVQGNWEQLLAAYRAIKPTLTENDWLCFDMLGRLWDLAQMYYSQCVFGQDPVEHMLTMKKMSGQINFGGFDGLQDWALIKRIHNEQLVDDAVVYSPLI